MKLGKLEKLDLRDYWKKEDKDFTPWLAQPDNIELLGEAIGIELELQGKEESVGPFSADILCKDTLNDHYVLIENQLEKTDHTHLGQLMTYAAGLDAVTIIWIAREFTEEHRAALDWLNRITDDTFNFFGIEIELYRIGDSVPAPMFNIVSKPNDWSKQVKRTASQQSVTDIKLKQKEYWSALKNYIEKTKSIVKMQNPSPQHWNNMAIGRSYFHLSSTVNSRDSSISIWLNITGEKAKDNFDKLYKMAFDKSLEEIGKDLAWERMDEKVTSAVILKTSADFLDQNDWENQFVWFKINLEKFIKFFKPIIAEL